MLRLARAPCLLQRSAYRHLSRQLNATGGQPEDKNALARLIAKSIKASGSAYTRYSLANPPQASGPLSIASYMSLCLSHPTEGYYTSKPVFGKQGDFITSPEISQIFGEVSIALDGPVKCQLKSASATRCLVHGSVGDCRRCS
jgi:hypothetical protein